MGIALLVLLPFASTLSVSQRVLETRLCSVFLSEWSEAYSHKDTSKWFRFFPVCDIPLRFISLNVIFSAPIGRIHPIFV